jgi:hypothetical protein
LPFRPNPVGTIHGDETTAGGDVPFGGCLHTRRSDERAKARIALN